MKAVQISSYGDDTIEINEIDKPTLKSGQVIVKVHAAAINPFDAKLRKGAYKDNIKLNLPVTLGADFAGTVIEVAEGTSGIEVGDEVFGSATVLNGGSGALAEFAAANTANLAGKPTTLDFKQAAAIVLVGVSAVQVIDQMNLQKGQKILIHGGAGGIGSNAIQYAKQVGAYVATTAAADEKDFVTSLGADETVDYQSQKFENVLDAFDAVFDTVGGDTYERSFGVLKPGGIIISMLEKPNEALMAKHKVTALLQATQVNTESLGRLTAFIAAGSIVPQIDREFPLEQAAQAFTHLETGRPKGKVVVSIQA